MQSRANTRRSPAQTTRSSPPHSSLGLVEVGLSRFSMLRALRAYGLRGVQEVQGSQDVMTSGCRWGGDSERSGPKSKSLLTGGGGGGMGY